MQILDEKIASDSIKASLYSNEWAEPIPFPTIESENAPYPIDALPGLLHTTVTEYQRYGQQPLALVSCGALANVSLACQALANVARDDYLVSPVSLYFIVMAESGERKTASDNMFSRAARLWEEKIREARVTAIHAAVALHRAWKTQCDEVNQQLKQDSFNGSPSISTRKLEDLMRIEPEIPLQPALYFEDITQEGLAHHLAKGWPSSSVWSDEAGFIVGSYSMQSSPTRFVALLNKLWDAKNFSTHRKSTDKFTLQHRRITINLMIQPVLMQELLSQPTNIVRQSGFLPRCLLAHPSSLMGKRFYKEMNGSLSCFDAYDRRITECLSETEDLTSKGCVRLPTLIMTTKAKTKWAEHFNQIESGLGENGRWTMIKDFASKASENVARLAALFHLFEGKRGDISVEHVESAIEIINWHLHETHRLLSSKSAKSPFCDAQKLMKWLIERKFPFTSQRDLQRISPLRDRIRLKEAIDVLIEHRILREISDSKKTILEVNPYCL